MGRMNIETTAIAGVHVIQLTPVSDSRGRFTRLFCEQELTPIRPHLHFVQINLSQSRGRGIVRGMHYQSPPAAEAKLIHCLRGRVFDVAVDLRAGSPTFLQWRGLELTESNDRAVFIPEGCAHGFQVLTDEADLLYMHTAPWTPTCEAGVRHDDARLAIAWPLPVTATSTRDRSYEPIHAAFTGVRL